MQIRVSVIAADFEIEETVEDYQRRLAERIPINARRIVDSSTPKGKLVRKGRITARKTAESIKSGLKVYRKTRMTIGNQFHRRSAPGQPWASETGRAKREIKVVRIGRGRFRVIFGAPYIGFLEFKLNRPVILPAVEASVREVFG